MSDFVELEIRCLALMKNMLQDPDRPFWQLEYVRILKECFSIIKALQDHNACVADRLDLMEHKLDQLSTKYSELLYRFSESKNDT